MPALTTKAASWAPDDYFGDVEDPYWGIMVNGPLKSGKTFVAATASEHFTLGPCSLDDMLWASVDRNALSGFREWGIKCPNHLNVHRWLMPLRPDEEPRPVCKDICDALDKLVKAASHRISVDPRIKFLVLDTISVLDQHIIDFWFRPERVPVSRRTGEADTQGAWGRVFTTHRNLFLSLSHLPVHFIVLCHARVMPEAFQSSDAASSKVQVSTMPGDGKITPHISGQSRELWTRNADGLLVLKTTRLTGDKGMRRTLHPFGGEGWEGGTRLQKALSHEEPANLREIFAKIAVTTNNNGDNAS